MRFFYSFPKILLHKERDCCTDNEIQHNSPISYHIAAFGCLFLQSFAPQNFSWPLSQLSSESYAAGQRLRITKRNFASSVNHIGKLVFHTLL